MVDLTLSDEEIQRDVDVHSDISSEDLPDISDPKFLAQCRKASLTVKTVSNLTCSMPLLTKDVNHKAQTTKVKIEKRQSERVRFKEPEPERLVIHSMHYAAT
jgi:hypothetical protein